MTTLRRREGHAYRPEIDGLRAMAIVPVVLHHSGIGAISGGYVGVDIFFVISGYLITTILIESLRKGQLSIAGFYERRARRILPAFFAVSVASAGFAWAFLPPQSIKSFGASLMSSAAFVSNHYFMGSFNYFAPDAEEAPLIHTWSLSVEEQFYLVLPCLLMLIWRVGPRWLPLGLTTALIASVMLCRWGWRLGLHPGELFYILPARASELLVGSLLASTRHSANRFLRIDPRYSENVRWILGYCGIAMIMAATIGFGKAESFPGPAGLVASAGAALVIAFGRSQDGVGRWLAASPLTSIGLISFSLYLWHQPILAFSRALIGEIEGAWELAGILTFTFALAFLTWRFVEEPFRHTEASRAMVLGASVGSLIFLGCLGFLFYSSIGHEAAMTLRYSKVELDVLKNLEYPKHIQQAGKECFQDPREGIDQARMAHCFDGAALESNPIQLYGDSHALFLYGGLRDQVQSAIIHFSSAGCPPVLGYSPHESTACRQMNERRFSEIRGNSSVILHARWARYASDPGFFEAVEHTLGKLRSQNPTAKILVLGSIPLWRPYLPIRLVREGLLELPEHEPKPIFTNRLGQLRQIDQRLEAVARQHGAKFASPLDTLCTDHGCRGFLGIGSTKLDPSPNSRRLLVWDDGHLTHEGAELVAKLVVNALVERNEASSR